MNMMTLKYIEKFKNYRGTVAEFIDEIPEKDLRSINITQLRTQCNRIRVK